MRYLRLLLLLSGMIGMGLAPAILALLTLFILREVINFAMLRLLMWRANADSTDP